MRNKEKLQKALKMFISEKKCTLITEQLKWLFLDGNGCHGRGIISGDNRSWQDMTCLLALVYSLLYQARKTKGWKKWRTSSVTLRHCLRIWMEWRQFFGSHVKKQKQKTQSRSSFHSSSFNCEMYWLYQVRKKAGEELNTLEIRLLETSAGHIHLTQFSYKLFHLFLTGFAPRKVEVNNRLEIY